MLRHSQRPHVGTGLLAIIPMRADRSVRRAAAGSIQRAKIIYDVFVRERHRIAESCNVVGIDGLRGKRSRRHLHVHGQVGNAGDRRQPYGDRSRRPNFGRSVRIAVGETAEDDVAARAETRALEDQITAGRQLALGLRNRSCFRSRRRLGRPTAHTLSSTCRTPRRPTRKAWKAARLGE
jgi:hypothetical protein